MRITRRSVLRGATGLGATFAFGRAWAATEMDLGERRITTLNDGYLQLPESFLIGDLPQGEARAILDAALELCEDSSLVALSLRQVAKQVGIVPTGFYRHFESIEDLDPFAVTSTGAKTPCTGDRDAVLLCHHEDLGMSIAAKNRFARGEQTQRPSRIGQVDLSDESIPHRYVGGIHP